ncbi:hypothetical protein MY11210_004506 [Beauveria gryllotalpidicola]
MPHRTKPGVKPLSRKRDKPLRTYGKRSTATPEPRSEPPAKRARTACTVLDGKNIKPLGFVVPEDFVPTVVSVFKAKPQPTAEQGQGKHLLSKPELNPSAKRSILNYFRPTTHLIPITPVKANTLPDAGPVEEKTDQPVARPKRRLLRIRLNQSIACNDETDQDQDHSRKSDKDEPKDVIEGILQLRPKRRLGGGGGSAGSDCRRVRRKPSSAEVQTTLNISSQAAFSECTILAALAALADASRRLALELQLRDVDAPNTSPNLRSHKRKAPDFGVSLKVYQEYLTSEIQSVGGRLPSSPAAPIQELGGEKLGLLAHDLPPRRPFLLLL